VNNGLTTLFTLALIIDPVNTNTVYVGTTGGGVFVTSDGGANWTALNGGLFNHVVTSLAIDPGNNKAVFAGTEGGGAFLNVRP